MEPLRPQAKGAEAIEELLADVSSDRMRAAAKLRSYLADGGSGRGSKVQVLGMSE